MKTILAKSACVVIVASVVTLGVHAMDAPEPKMWSPEQEAMELSLLQSEYLALYNISKTMFTENDSLILRDDLTDMQISSQRMARRIDKFMQKAKMEASSASDALAFDHLIVFASEAIKRNNPDARAIDFIRRLQNHHADVIERATWLLVNAKDESVARLAQRIIEEKTEMIMNSRRVPKRYDDQKRYEETMSNPPPSL